MAGMTPGELNSYEMALWWLAPAAAAKSCRDRNKAAGKNLCLTHASRHLVVSQSVVWEACQQVILGTLGLLSQVGGR